MNYKRKVAIESVHRDFTLKKGIKKHLLLAKEIAETEFWYKIHTKLASNKYSTWIYIFTLRRIKI